MTGQKRLESLKEICPERDGQALAEYTFIVMLIALVCIGALALLGNTLQGFYTGFIGSL